MSLTALIFINGTVPLQLPNLNGYDLIVCTDGALHYLMRHNFSLKKLDFVIGDFDSLTDVEHVKDKLIYTPDQNHTDFYKALEFLKNKGCKHIDVFGASGCEQDHFLGNLTAAYKFKDELTITFYDEFGQYFFIKPYFKIAGVLGKIISLVPYPTATNITTTGLKWCLHNEDLTLTERIGTRNIAISDAITCAYKNGALLLFINQQQ